MPAGRAATVVAAFFLSACACGLPARGLDQATQQLPGFAHRRLAGADFPLHAWLRLAGPGETLTVVIEGDGAGWFNPRWPPADPTPERSQALALAAHLPGAVAYLARPCQFEQGKACRAEHWTSRRFAAELVGALDGALDALKRESGATKLRLVGHSGGGVMAVLLAQRRDDVGAVLTLMAPLDLAAWTEALALSPLAGPDPGRLPPLRVPAIHVAGGKDDIVPAALVARHVERKGGKFVLWTEADHACWSLAAASRLAEELP